MYGIHLAYNLIRPDDKVLDVGGWVQPFRRANAVIDFLPYESRQTNNTFLLGLREHFSKQTWFQQDICDHHTPFPFQDKEFDFVVCGQVLEDVRDPIYVVEEMQRVGKRGYIEVPSRFYEQLLGLEFEKMCGASHHRWFIDLRVDKQSNRKELVFIHKSHAVHFFDNYRLRRPKFSRYFPYQNLNFANLGLFWEGGFTAREDVSAAIDGCRDFMQETLRLADQLGDRLWNQMEGFPCEFTEYPFSKGIISLWELEHLIKRRVLHYDLHRNRTKEILDYEKAILSGNIDKKDTGIQNLIVSSGTNSRQSPARLKRFFGSVGSWLRSASRK